MSTTTEGNQRIKQRSRDDLISFCIATDQFANNPYECYNPKPYHENIADALERLYRWEIKKLMISIPPQFWKSTLAAINFPARVLGKSPSTKFALASYGADLAEHNGSKCRDLVRSDIYKSIFGGVLKSDSQAKNERYTEWGWRYTCVWIWWALTGKTVDIMIIDDYLKGSEEANSKTMKDKVWDRYNTVALSRLHMESKQIVIATRRSEDDLIGRILGKWAKNWEQVIIPCFDDEWESIRPERHNKQSLLEKKDNDEQSFQTLYMCNPIPEGGVFFKREYFAYYDESEVRYQWKWMRDVEVVTFVDPAISQRQQADNTAIVTVALDKKWNYIYVIDIDFGKFTPDEIIEKTFEKARVYWGRVWLETNQYQKMLEMEIRKQMRLRNRFFVLEWQPSMWDKEAKIKHTLHPRYSNKTILHKKHWKWVWDMETELLMFPNGKHDDICDCLAMAIKMLNVYTQGSDKVYSMSYWEQEDTSLSRSQIEGRSDKNFQQPFYSSEW
jgi:predicted phage terminase large subunit-like protein